METTQQIILKRDTHLEEAILSESHEGDGHGGNEAAGNGDEAANKHKHCQQPRPGMAKAHMPRAVSRVFTAAICACTTFCPALTHLPLLTDECRLVSIDLYISWVDRPIDEVIHPVTDGATSITRAEDKMGSIGTLTSGLGVRAQRLMLAQPSENCSNPATLAKPHTWAWSARPKSEPKTVTEGATSAYTAAKREVSRLRTPARIWGRSHTTMKLSTRLTPTCDPTCAL